MNPPEINGNPKPAIMVAGAHERHTMKPVSESADSGVAVAPDPTEDIPVFGDVQDRHIQAKVEALYARARKGHRLHMVYVDWDGTVNIVRSDAKKFDRILNHYPELVAGVYGSRVDPRQARGDIEATLESLGLR